MGLCVDGDMKFSKIIILGKITFKLCRNYGFRGRSFHTDSRIQRYTKVYKYYLILSLHLLRHTVTFTVFYEKKNFSKFPYLLYKVCFQMLVTFLE